MKKLEQLSPQNVAAQGACVVILIQVTAGSSQQIAILWQILKV